MSNTTRIVLFGDGRWAANSLARLHDAGHDIVGVVVRRRPSDPLLQETASRLKIRVLQPSDVNAPDFVAAIASHLPDLGLSISFDQILRKEILTTARKGYVNFHAGKLPRYRGRNVINWALINGETEIGLTSHWMDEGIDTGGIILQKTLPITWTDTYGTVLDRVVAAFPEFVLDTMDLVLKNTPVAKPQEFFHGTYYGGREEGDEWLDWADTSTNLYNKIRAITRPGPGARTLDGMKEVVIWKARYDPDWPKYIATPGQVVGRRNEGVLVKTGDSVLLVTEIQFENADCMTPSWRIGTRLGIDPMRLYKSLIQRIEQLESQVNANGLRSHRDK